MSEFFAVEDTVSDSGSASHEQESVNEAPPLLVMNSNSEATSMEDHQAASGRGVDDDYGVDTAAHHPSVSTNDHDRVENNRLDASLFEEAARLVRDQSEHAVVTNEESGAEPNYSNSDENTQIHTFCSAYQLWRDHAQILKYEALEETCSQGRRVELFAALHCSTNNQAMTQVVLHSLKTESMNDQVGTLASYQSEKDRFLVTFPDHDKSVSLKPQNLRLLVKDTSTGTGEDDDSAKDIEGGRMTKEQLVSVLFRPGTMFLGSIRIPGLQGGKRQYRLVIDSHYTLDEMGQPLSILARHRAYDDEQFAWINVETTSTNEAKEESGITIHYADSETHCHGTWNQERLQFEGTVRQLLPTEDGLSVYHTQEVTHTFTLSPTSALHPFGTAASFEKGRQEESGDKETELQRKFEMDLVSPATCAIVDLRSKTDKLFLGILDEFKDLCKVVTSWSTYVLSLAADSNRLELQSVFKLAEMAPWKDLLSADNLAAERTCAYFRRFSEIMDRKPFSSPDERASFLAELKKKGVSRVQAHYEKDEFKEIAQSVCSASATISSILDSSTTRPDITQVLIMCSRLERAFARLDDSLRRAEERLTDADISTFSCRLESQAVEDAEAIDERSSEAPLCAICRVDLKDTEDIDSNATLRLPCTHAFHEKCVREWLHNHAHCPVCRSDLCQQEQPQPAQIEE